jgi:membrane associated rhomboid family serine protease
MSYPLSDEIERPRLTPAVLWLLAINVAMFFVQSTVQQNLPDVLAFSRGGFVHEHDYWTVGTYMFAHAGFWHLALNMYMLWAFGPRLEERWTPGAFTRYYLWCGLGGAVFHALLVNGNAPMVGASAAVLGVVLAYAMRWPDEEVYLFGIVPMKVKWLVAFMAITNLGLGMLSFGQAGGGTAYLAHVGGFAFGWIYLRTPTAQSFDRLRERIAQAPDVTDDPPRAVPRSLPRPRERGPEVDEIVAKSKAIVAKQRPAAPPPPPVAAVATKRADDLNLVLDKISEHGLGSLTSDERLLLEEMSRRLRQS